MTRIQQSLLILQMVRAVRVPIVKYMAILHLAGNVDEEGKPKPLDNQELQFRMGSPQHTTLQELVRDGLAVKVGEGAFQITRLGLDFARQITDGKVAGISGSADSLPAVKKPDMKKVHAFLGTPASKRS